MWAILPMWAYCDYNKYSKIAIKKYSLSNGLNVLYTSSAFPVYSEQL